MKYPPQYEIQQPTDLRIALALERIAGLLEELKDGMWVARRDEDVPGTNVWFRSES